MKTTSTSSAAAVETTRLFGTEDEAPVLIVMDMMLEFKASRDPETLAAVAAEIRAAMSRNEAIIFVEYAGGNSSTYRELLEIVEGYSFFTVVEKHTDGGAEEVFEACMDNGYWPENFRIVGVNADGCVFQTVEGLRKRLKNSRIEVIRAACHTDSGWRNWPSKFDGMKNVAVV